jgi:hypothetical protein
MRVRAFALAAALLASACHHDASFTDVDLEQSCEIQTSAPEYFFKSVDMLFVVDRTASMADQRAGIAQYARDMGSRFEELDRMGIRTDVHIAVTSSDLGGAGVLGCSGYGDDGRFLDARRCGADDTFLKARRLADGSLVANFGGELVDTIACVLDVEPSPCPVSQPVAAAERAITSISADHHAWRRADARLMVSVITDGDDCSLRDVDALAGVTGATPAEVEAAVDQACAALGAAGVALLDPLPWLADKLERHHWAFWFSGVHAGADPASTCAGPAPRLSSLQREDFGRGVGHADVCSDDWSPALSPTEDLEFFPLVLSCLPAEVDLEPAVPGFQVACAVEIQRGRDDGSLEPIGRVPTCVPGLAPGVPCYELDPIDRACEGGRRFDFHRGDLVDPAVIISVRCEVPCG